jgi:hypothetical protein
MKIVEKKMEKVVIEITSEEIDKLGFDRIWDDIRTMYPAKKYEVDHTEETHSGRIILVVLIDKEYFNSMLGINRKYIENDEDT